MKFTDGNWLHKKGVTPHYAAEAYQITDDAEGLTLLVPCSPIRHRGDTLGGPLLTVRLRAPRPGIIAVKITHFEGVVDKGPHFDLNEDPSDFDWEVTDSEVRFRSGSLTLVISRNPWSMRFESGGRLLTTSPNRGAAWMEVDGQGAFAMAQLGLSVGEQVYGLGERFTPFIKNGQSIEIWNEDGGTNSDQAYKNIPFYLTSRGYGVLVNSPAKVSFEVGSERTNIVQFSIPGESIEYMVIEGPTPKDVLSRYTALAGRPALPPQWSFGLWLSTSFTTNYDEATVNEFIQGMADRDIPLSVFHYDCFWMRGFLWCDFEWDPAVFPDPKGMLQRLHDRGLKVCAWINPYIAQASHLFAEGKAKGFLVKKPNGDVWQWDMWQPGMGLVDFTNPEATTWFQSKLAALIDQGVDALKTDFGERIPIDVVWHDGSDSHRMHNWYTQLYNQAVFEVLEAKKGKGEAVLFARSATVGGQKLPVHWGGDCWSTFEAMAESLRGGLSLCMSGFGFWSHDIGGFEGKPPLEIYARWVAFGLLSSHSRLHGSGSYRVPWVYGEEGVEALRFFTKLKLSLMPYLWASAHEAYEKGIPMMRAMHLEFPDDPACEVLDRQYMLGDSLLVAPVFSESGEVTFYVPAGRWTSVIDGKVYKGPGWFTETHGLLSLPLLARPNSLIAFGQNDRPDYDTREPLNVSWFEPLGSAEGVLRGPRGEVRRMRGLLASGAPVVELDEFTE